MSKILIAIALVFLVLVVLSIRAHFRRVEGVWVQDEGDGWLEILLEQFGPFVTGRCYVEGGHYDYTGYWTGKVLRLKRRDYGQDLLVSKGFPASLAPKLEGTVMAKFSLRLVDSTTLNGFFFPQKIKWDKTQHFIDSRKYIEPRWRVWFRHDSPAAEEMLAKKAQRTLLAASDD